MTSNPMLKPRVLEGEVLTDEPMLISGVINKSLFLTLIVALSGYFTWDLCAKGFMDKVSLLSIIGLIGGIILCLVTVFAPRHSKITAPMYALCEGLIVGSISYAYGSLYHGIVQNALLITILVMLIMLSLYKSGVLRATPTFRKVILISTMAIGIFYLVGIVASFLGHPMTIFNGGLVGIGVSLLICGVAALNFILDFDSIERFAQNNMPKYFEWYFAFSILVTLIWLYLEVLRLLAQLNSRRN